MTALQRFVSTRHLSYLYATVKTHKVPMGWRHIAGGTGTSLEEPNRWLNCILQKLMPEVDELHVRAAGRLEVHPDLVGFFKHPAHEPTVNPKDKTQLMKWARQDRLIVVAAERWQHAMCPPAQASVALNGTSASAEATVTRQASQAPVMLLDAPESLYATLYYYYYYYYSYHYCYYY